MTEVKADNIVWWLMITFMGVILLGGGAWATHINSKVEEIAAIKTNVALMQKDVADIKELFKSAIRRELNGLR